ncbi:hypothetical protein KSP40_PGU018709 [Platanthera guangdongensis]|uniref:Uncharacterized protein n=1 Tax=Platanthera guangdongensis TaxID=2320717 RepID=A0ABR2MPE5_9ASPA
MSITGIDDWRYWSWISTEESSLCTVNAPAADDIIDHFLRLPSSDLLDAIHLPPQITPVVTWEATQTTNNEDHAVVMGQWQLDGSSLAAFEEGRLKGRGPRRGWPCGGWPDGDRPGTDLTGPTGRRPYRPRVGRTGRGEDALASALGGPPSGTRTGLPWAGWAVAVRSPASRRQPRRRLHVGRSSGAGLAGDSWAEVAQAPALQGSAGLNSHEGRPGRGRSGDFLVGASRAVAARAPNSRRSGRGRGHAWGVATRQRLGQQN